MNKKLHIVSFDIPYPPNYGGIIDVFYKIKELYKLDVEIYLHTFVYNGKKKQDPLKKYCKEIFYYPRRNSFTSLFSNLPFRVISRKSKSLNNNLLKTEAPILFEGLNTTYSLYKFNLKNSYVRTHNIEDKYFLGLAKSEKNYFLKLMHYVEAIKQKQYEDNLKKASGLFTISLFEQDYFSKKFTNKTHYIPAFHDTKTITNHSKKGDYILFHGDLRVADNIKACLFLIDVYKNTTFKFVVATSLKVSPVITEINKHKNIELAEFETQKELDVLLKKAHINTLFSFQKTGIKLKLLNTLHKGKFIIANTPLIEDTGLEDVCEIANTKEEILRKTATLYCKDFEKSEIEKRVEILKQFSPEKSAKQLVQIIFNQN
ncbi:hypothetical protein [Polaribacter sp.]|uniref:hypothetical protein n=1 Tax=Polaribacter sp. TaxID=1920175 RepID=UPI003F6B36D4